MTVATDVRAASPPPVEASRELGENWRALARSATFVAILTSPAVFVWLHNHQGWDTRYALGATLFEIAAFRGFVDVLFRRFIPWPSLFGTDDPVLRAEDVISRRRASFWRTFWKLVQWAAIVLLLVWIVLVFFEHSVTPAEIVSGTWHAVKDSWSLLGQLIILPMFFLINFAIIFGPMLAMGIAQIRGFQPGNAEWGVKLDDVRGQAEAKEEIRRIVSLWQSGEQFERHGGKRERGILFLGAPGTGKTMLAKAIATGFNSPFVTIPGSGFQQSFMGLDAILVRYLARKAKRLARKWGGQCIVFIDEIDAVGMRRQSLGGGDVAGAFQEPTFERSGDLVLETRAWRERVFAERAPERPGPGRMNAIVNQLFPGMSGMGGGLALNQLLVVMDGLDAPPLGRRMMTSFVNTLLDASSVVPARMGDTSLRLPPPPPRREQIYFIGATNVPIGQLDPALTRPGRMGRHVWFRTPTKQDRVDIFELYLGKVSHHEDLDRPRRRDELARMTMGYSPAMIEQVCSMALTIAHHSQGRGVDAHLDPAPRLVAGASHGSAEGRAVLVVALGGDLAARVGARRDGGRARLLRRELDRRRRRRAGGDRPRGMDGRRVRHGAGVRRVLADPGQRAMVEQLLGQAYLKAHHLMDANRRAVERVADTLVERRELHGDEVVHLLDAQQIAVPEIDLMQESAWPRL